MLSGGLLNNTKKFSIFAITSLMSLPSPIRAAKEWTIYFMNSANQTFSVVDHGTPNAFIDQKIQALVKDNNFNITKIAGGSTTQLLTELCKYPYVDSNDDDRIGLVKLFGMVNTTLANTGITDFAAELTKACKEGIDEQSLRYTNVIFGIIAFIALSCCVYSISRSCPQRSTNEAPIASQPLLNNNAPADAMQASQQVELSVTSESNPNLQSQQYDAVYPSLGHS